VKRGLKILVVLLVAGVLIFGGVVYTILSQKNITTLSFMKTTFAEEVLQCNNHPKGIYFKILGPGIIEEVLKTLNLSEDELKTYWDQGKTLLDYAQDKGITKEKLIEAFKKVIVEKLNQLVLEGKITETEKENFLSNIESRIEEFITKTPPFKNGKGMPKDNLPFEQKFLCDGKNLIEEVLTRLNLSLDEFQNAMKDKKSLLEFVESKGITKDELIKVVKEVVIEKVNQLVKDGKITEDQKTKFIERLDEFVERFINGPGHRRGRKGNNSIFTPDI
jgi:polyhydroxyalkanoate synthesis regulator phasin